jgi:NADPH:quinone reductase
MGEFNTSQCRKTAAEKKRRRWPRRATVPIRGAGGCFLVAIPDQSKVTIYGGLSLEPVRVNRADLIFAGKSVDGFWLTAWIGRKNLGQSLMLWRRAQKLMDTTLKSEVRARYGLAKAHSRRWPIMKAR